MGFVNEFLFLLLVMKLITYLMFFLQSEHMVYFFNLEHILQRKGHINIDWYIRLLLFIIAKKLIELKLNIYFKVSLISRAGEPANFLAAPAPYFFSSGSGS